MSSDETDNNLQIRVKAEHTIADLDALKAFCDPLRHQMMRVLSERPLTIREVADKINRTFSSLYYHINILEKHGLIYVAGMRPISGAVAEKYYHISAKVYRIQRQLRTFMQDSQYEPLELQMENAFDATRSDIRDGLNNGALSLDLSPPHPDSILIEKRMRQLPPEQASAFYQQLLELLNSFEQQGMVGEEIPSYALTFALHPLPKR